MKSLGGSGIIVREVWFKKRAVRVSGSNLKAACGRVEKPKPQRRKILMAELQLLCNRLIAAQVHALQVFEQTTALADHHQKPAARTVILFVGLQMLSQMVDAMREQRDLHVRRTRVLGVRLKLFNSLCLRFHIYERENLIERDCRVKPI
jgi:hypothetical protein